MCVYVSECIVLKPLPPVKWHKLQVFTNKTKLEVVEMSHLFPLKHSVTLLCS